MSADRQASRPFHSDSWIRIGIVSGFLAVLAYGLISAAPLTPTAALILACVFGPALACASAGLYHLIRLHRRTVSLDLGLAANVVAGIVITITLFAQLGLRRWFELKFGEGSTESLEPAFRAAFQAGNGIQLGLDVAWDLFLAIGTMLLAWNMRGHPRFGRLYAVTGIGVAAALLVVNLVVFPEPPGEAGSIDLGPLIGLWYLIVTIRLATSSRWVADRVSPDT